MEEEEHNTILSLVELSPILVPYFIGFYIFRGYFVNFPLYLQIKSGLTDTEIVQIWAIISGFALLIGALTRLPAGLISDKIGRLNAIFMAYSIYLVSTIVIIISSHSIFYILAMGFVRFGVNTFAMTGRSIVSQSKRDVGLKNGLLSSMVGLGSFFGPYSLAYVLKTSKNSEMMFYVSLIIIAVDFLLFVTLYILIPRYVQSKFRVKSDVNMGPVNISGLRNVTYLFKYKQVLQIFFLFFAAGMVYGLITQVYSIYGFNILAINLTLIGFITGAGAFVQVFWAPITGKLYQFVKDEHMRIFAFSLILIATIFMVLSPFGVFFFIIGYFVLNFGNASYFTMEITRIAKLVKPDEFSTIFGIATSLIILATAIAGFISPLFYNIIPEGTYYAALIFSFTSFVIVVSTSFRSDN